MNGEVVQVLDLWAADAQTSGESATGRNRPYMRETGCTAATHWEAEKISADERETDTAGCF